MSLIPARVDSIALPVADVARSARFYRDTMRFEQLPSTGGTFSIAGKDVPAADAIISFRLENLVVVIIDRRLLAVEMNVDELPPPGASSMGIRVPREEVEIHMTRLAEAGVRVLAPAQDYGPLKIGFVADPDGHVWEIIQDPSGPVRT
jgi:uncharacterized glyoxalase superfamily protein PhnB